jgi:hypothetical protein
VIELNPNDWQWFPVFMVDLPFSLLWRFIPPVLAQASPFAVLTILGTLWWYFVAILIRVVLTWHPRDGST